MKPTALTCAVLLLALCFSPVAVENRGTAAKPNIVFMYVDNLGYGDLGCYGNKEIRTPRIDRLATEGTRCTDFYVVASTCTVSRQRVGAPRRLIETHPPKSHGSVGTLRPRQRSG